MPPHGNLHKENIVRQVIQCSATVLLSLCTTFAFAEGYDYNKEDLSGYSLQPNLKIREQSDYARNGHAVYLYGGYLFTHRFLSSTSQTFTSPSGDISYIPKNALPANYNGVEVGFGKEWTRYLDLQLAYLQSFQETKTHTAGSNSFNVQEKMNGFLADINWVMNPDDQFQVSVKLGAALTEFKNSTSINNSSYYTVSDNTKVDPAVGMDFLFEFTKHFGMRVGTLYIADTQQGNSNGEVQALAGLNYVV